MMVSHLELLMLEIDRDTCNPIFPMGPYNSHGYISQPPESLSFLNLCLGERAAEI